jgi:NRPS condensation-like uncharacterized protein
MSRTDCACASSNERILGDKMYLDEQKSNGYGIPGCVRRLSNFERIFLWNIQSNVSMAARVVGDVSEKDLLRAVNAARRMHPLLGAKVIFDNQHNAWFSTDNVPETILRTVPRTSDTQWVDEIQREHMAPFELETGPLIRFVLVYSRQVSELIAFSNHGICDGVALANLIRDILIFYAEPAKEIKVIEPPLSADYLQRDEDPALSNSVGKDAINNFNHQWRQRPHYFSQADSIEVHKAYWEKMQHKIILLQLEPQETSTLVAKCRENGVTIISATTAAFVAAYQEIIGPFLADQNIMGIPYDLRRRLPEKVGDAFCFFVGVSSFSIAYDQEKTIWENAQKIHKIIHKDIDRLNTGGPDVELFDPTLIDACFGFAHLMQFIPEAFERTNTLSDFARDTTNIALMISGSRKIAAIINTNLGRLDYPETYGGLRLDRMFFVPPAANLVPLILGGIGINGKLAFTLNYVKDMKEDDGSSRDQDWIRIRNRVLELLGFPEKASDRAI